MRAAVVYDDALLLWSRLFAGSRACHTSNTFSTQLPYGAPGRGVVSFREAGDVPANRAAPELPGRLAYNVAASASGKLGTCLPIRQRLSFPDAWQCQTSYGWHGLQTADR